jgi:tRNA threonylcarbamoyl adenosine modification protein YeaZ
VSAIRGPVLAIDASSRRPTVALLGPGGEEWGRWTQPEGKRGTADLAVQAARLLEERRLGVPDLHGVAVGIGPGSYTGLRASIALARALVHTSPRRLASVVSAEAAALGILRQHAGAQEVTVLVDARREECYRADYRRDGALPAETSPPRLVGATEASALETREGSGVFVVREPCPDGYDVAALGRRRLVAGGDDPASVLPLYLKRSHAEIALQERARRR